MKRACVSGKCTFPHLFIQLNNSFTAESVNHYFTGKSDCFNAAI